MITDTINKEWLLATSELADRCEAGEATIAEFTNDQLHWLIYYNWGYSGSYAVPETVTSINELRTRGVSYDEPLAEAIDNITQEYY